MATGADLLRAAALHEVGEPYVWGAEGSGGVEGNDAYDCSGYAHSMWEAAGYKIARMTANDYYRKGNRIGQPSLVGDAFVLLDKTGHAYHIGLYVGEGQTAEARGKKYGVVSYPVPEANKRGAIWIRMPGMNLGALTGAIVPLPPVVKPPKVMPQLSKGSVGSTVKVLQRAVNHFFGRRVLADDGVFGKKTLYWVVRAQMRMWRLKPWRWDGIVGPLTWGKLNY
jgi:cell wall-associated NlpC family hydrolase